MGVYVECLPADKSWDVVSVTRRSSGVAPRACVRVHARVLVPPTLYIQTSFERCKVFVGGVRLGCCSRRVCVCVSLSGVLFSVGVCVCDWSRVCG